MSWFDTHCHLQTFLRKGELDAVLQRANDAGVKKMVTVGTAPDDWKDYQNLAQKYPNQIFYSAGLHPGYVDENWAQQVKGLRNYWGKERDPVALGEIGLDYFRLPKDPGKAEKIIFWQKEAFRNQLEIAKEIDCPVIIHSRNAFEDCVREIDGSGVKWEKVVFHCFTEGIDEVAQLVERGGYASFTGIITFPKNDTLLAALKYQGLKKLMLETDSPYLAPVPHRGKRNEPAHIVEIGRFVCDCLTPNAQTNAWENAHNFYRL